MSAIATPAAAAPARTRSFLTSAPVWRVGALAGVLAAVAAEVYAAAADAAGVSMLTGGWGAERPEPIPTGGFAVSVLMWTAVGTLIAVVLARRAARPARTWVRTTLVLTALSFVPTLLTHHTAPSTKAMLCGAHVVAASIVIPLLARRLSRSSRG
jgi:hypothetical protein